MRVEVALNLVGRLTLRFADDGYQLSTPELFKIENQVTVSIDRVTLFHGEVGAVSLDHSHEHVPELVVTVDEPTAKLARTGGTRTFEMQTTTDVLTKVVHENGLRLRCSASGFTSTPDVYRLQLGSNLAFLDEVVRAANAVWRYEHPNVVRIDDVGPDDGQPVRVGPGGDGSVVVPLLTFSIRATRGQPKHVQVRGWDPHRGTHLEARSDKHPSPESEFVRPARATLAGPVVTNAGGAESHAEAELLAKAVAVSAQADAVTARGTTPVEPRIRPGVLVEAEGVGPSSGRYLVTRVEHVYDRRGFHTVFQTGSHRPRGLVDTMAAGEGRSDARVDGVLVGVVTDLNDPDGYGRVRVKLPVLEHTSGEIQTAWARVATFDAGQQRGATFLPEVDDEVLVAFEGGSVRRPVVIGALFSGKRQQPELGRLLSPNKAKVNVRRLTSRTGHTLEMVDEDGNDQLLLRHGKGEMKVALHGPTKKLTVESHGGDIELTTGQASISLFKNGDIKIKGVRIEVDAMMLSVAAKGTATVKAEGPVSVEGATATVKGNGSVVVQAGGIAAVKGASVAIN
ncbi:phage baseplate assembly protein V [Nocardioides sp. TF02-7]|uniref:phage baseplate assembly protein V n=1 Tax=Nocardioides sp. TF02-7 TaxID=2917724 RepID=UPI001F070B83|nr:phage baseplate assembly protein V [Nocardioides sp. TF02-7]UMG94811.1 phage baseplate assembly protein V [Nocardioides sp. TF02-7]